MPGQRRAMAMRDGPLDGSFAPPPTGGGTLAGSARLREALHGPGGRLVLGGALSWAGGVAAGFAWRALPGAGVALLVLATAAAGAALAAAFIREMRRREAELSAANQILAQRVSERTEALAASEARLRRVQEVGRVGGFEIDLRSGTNFRSAEYMKVQGHQPLPTIEGHAEWLARLHPDDRALAERRYLDAVADDAPDLAYAQEYRIRDGTGAIRWIAARAEIERDAQGRACRMVGAHLDITELKLAQAAAQEGEARLRAALRSARLGVWERHLPSGTATWDSRAIEIYGLTPANDPALVQWRDRVHPEDQAARLDAIAGAVGPGGADSYDATFRFRRTDGGWNWISVHGSVVERDQATGQAVRLAGVVQDETDRVEAMAALRERETWLRLAQEAGGVGSWEWDIARGALHWSASCHHLHGTDPSPPLTAAAWFARVHPEDRARVMAAQRAAIRGTAEGWDVEFRFSRPADGRECWLVGRGRIYRDPATGRALKVRGVSLDTTARKQVEEQQRFLAREIDHRCKNTLSVVLAALRLTPKRDLASYAGAIEGRVKALARAHTLLAEGRWAGADLHSLAQGELAPFLAADAAGPMATLAGPPVTLSPAAAQGLSMSLHELATNATKYGALSAPQGRLAVSWWVDAEAGRLRLHWAETGGPPVVAPTHRGFGSRVVEATVRDQLGGSVTRAWTPQGLACTLEVPLAQALPG